MLIHKLARSYSQRARARRGALFLRYLQPTPADHILDLGGGDGSHLASLLPFRANVTVADVNPALLTLAEQRYGFQTAQLNESGRLPFPERCFDIVFCSSVIEHITAPKHNLRTYRDNMGLGRFW